jgi:hypothetical protein
MMRATATAFGYPYERGTNDRRHDLLQLFGKHRKRAGKEICADPKWDLQRDTDEECLLRVRVEREGAVAEYRLRRLLSEEQQRRQQRERDAWEASTAKLIAAQGGRQPREDAESDRDDERGR